MELSEHWIKLNADYAILWQVLVSLIGAKSATDPALIPNLLKDLEDFVQRIEESQPVGCPQAQAYRLSLEQFRGVLDRSRLIPF